MTNVILCLNMASPQAILPFAREINFVHERQVASGQQSEPQEDWGRGRLKGELSPQSLILSRLALLTVRPQKNLARYLKRQLACFALLARKTANDGPGGYNSSCRKLLLYGAMITFTAAISFSRFFSHSYRFGLAIFQGCISSDQP